MSSTEPPLQIRNTEDNNMIEVCLEEDGIRSCTLVSSMHLTYEKRKMLHDANTKKAAAIFKDISQLEQEAI